MGNKNNNSKKTKCENIIKIVDINDNFEVVDSPNIKILSAEEIISKYPNLTEETKIQTFNANILKNTLKDVKGQQDNIDVIIKETQTWIRRVKKRKPLVFMLAGTSGTGKTFTVETICNALKDYRLVKLNMNEYHNHGDTWKLLGSTTGHIGSDQESPIFSARKETDKLVILFDEIEKAHESLFTTIMTLMEKGEMANGHGQVSDFKQSIIFFTTNLAMKELLLLKKESVHNGLTPSTQEFQDAAKAILKSSGLREEISGRIDWLLVFNSLTSSIVGQICLNKIRSLGEDYDIRINMIPHSYLENVAKQCAGNNEGARPINRIVTSDFEPIFQDAYEEGRCDSNSLYDIDESFNIFPSQYDTLISVNEITIDNKNNASNNDSCTIPTIKINTDSFFRNGYNYDDFKKATGLLRLDDGTSGYGSSFIISSNGYIMTCAHCTEANKITFVKDDDKSEYSAKVIYKNINFDIAILKIEADNMPYLLITDSNRPLKVGAEIVLLGYPSGIDINDNVSAFEGKISNFDRARKTYQTDAIAAPGSSGGALISKKEGVVYGVLCGGYKDAGINIATDIRNLLQNNDEDIIIEYV